MELVEFAKAVTKSVPAFRLVAKGVYDRAARLQMQRFRHHCRRLGRIIPNPTFVKVGANDGVTGDPCSDILLANDSWVGLLIEPVPCCFARLKRNFQDSTRFSLEQVAIGATVGRNTFYCVDDEAAKSIPDLPVWYDQLGSFDKSHILKHLDGVLEPYILECEVEVCSLTDVLRRNKLQHIHLLHIDTEGYDFEVLKTLDFGNYTPIMILIEHAHLTRDGKAEMRRFLYRHGYTVRSCGSDYCALDRRAYRKLKQAARK